nr:hypothetical protein [Tanacetum cinerariifolium]
GITCLLYGPKQSTTSESDAKTSDLDSFDSSYSKETLETVPKPVESKPQVINKPKVSSDAPIIEEYESDSDDEYVSKASVEQTKPSCAFINTVKHVKTPRQTIQDQDTCSQNPKFDQRDWAGLKSKRMGLGYGYTKKSCFVCGSFSHLIRDCDFHEKRMAKHVELNKQKGSFKCWLIITPQMVINSQCLTDKKELAIPGQTATGKELSNPLMAGSFPKTTLPTKLLKVNAARLKLTTARVYATEEKPTEIEGFAQIIDFLNGSSVKYALTTSPTIYSSCIKQFWTSAKVKTINDEVRIQALVEGKRVNIKESFIRCTLRLDTAEGTSCLTNIEIFEGLAKMGFVLLIINQQLGDMAHHKEIFNTPSLIKKVFANMKRVGTGFSREVTLLFDNMLVQAPEEVVLELENEVIDIKSTYQERIEKLEGRVERLEEENRGRKIADIDADVEINLEKAQAEAYNLDFDHQEKVLSMMDVNEEELADVEEVLEVVKAAKLMTEVVTTAGATKVSVPRNKRGVIIQDLKETTTIATVQPKEAFDTSSSQKEYDCIFEKHDWFQDGLLQGMTYDEIRPIFKKHYNYNQAFLDGVNEGVKVSKTEVSSKREDATPLATKIPIIDYKIHTERNRPYFKIIKADGNHIKTNDGRCHSASVDQELPLGREESLVETETLAVVSFGLAALTFNWQWSSDLEDSHVNDRFATVEGMYAVPPPMTGVC